MMIIAAIKLLLILLFVIRCQDLLDLNLWLLPTEIMKSN